MKKTLAKKFGIYSAIGVAGGLTFGTTAAEADIIFTDFTGSATQGNPLNIDLDGDTVTDFVFDLFVTPPNQYGSLSNWARMTPGVAGNGFAATVPAPFGGGAAYGPNNLAYGASISGQSFYAGADGGPLQLAYTFIIPVISMGPSADSIFRVTVPAVILAFSSNRGAGTLYLAGLA